MNDASFPTSASARPKTPPPASQGETDADADWIRLEKVALVRSGKTILDAIDWNIAPGAHWVVLGANGSGKTTLLQLLAGYLWPTRGTITVLGHRFGQIDLRELRKSIGWVGSFLQVQIPSQEKALDLIVSGKFASIGIFAPPEPEDYRLAREMAERLHCEGILEQPYGVLSQGEKQRVLIARALIHEPRLLILDEPAAGLDLLAREQLLQTLEQLGRSQQAPTLIFVTHHLEEIMPVFSHILVLKGGRILKSGSKPMVMDPEVLSAAFGIALQVTPSGGRYLVAVQGGLAYF